MSQLPTYFREDRFTFLAVVDGAGEAWVETRLVAAKSFDPPAEAFVAEAPKSFFTPLVTLKVIVNG